MRKAKSFRRDLYKQFDFELDLAVLHNPLSADCMRQAIGLGRPFYRTCTHLNIEAEQLADLVKDQLLYDLWEKAQHLDWHQVELMQRYPDETVLGQTLAALHKSILYHDPTAWLEAFANPLHYLKSQHLGPASFQSAAGLNETAKKQASKRVFGQVPLCLDNLFNEQSAEAQRIKRDWAASAGKSGAGFRSFQRLLTQTQYRHPAPGSASANKQAIAAQYEHFKMMLAALSTEQGISGDLLAYEQEHLTGFLFYAARRMQHYQLLAAADPEDLGKHQAAIKTVGLLGLLRSPEIRVLLLENLLNEGRPFDYDNMEWARDIPDLDLELLGMVQEHHLYEEDVKEGQIALLLSLIGTIEQALPLFVEESFGEIVRLLYPMQIGEAVDDADAQALLQLKRQLIPFVLLSDLGMRYSQQDLQHNPLFAIDPEDVPDRYFEPLYRWTYKVRKEWQPHTELRFIRIYWLRHLQENLLRDSDVIWDNCLDIGQHFRKWAGIKPEHLGLDDISAWIAEHDEEWEIPPAAPPKRSLHRG